MEKTGFVDQKAAGRFERVRTLVLAEAARFAAQGSVVTGWRLYGGRRLGPYFRLAYREGGRQRSIYLGRCAELARRVRELLAGLQHPRRQRRLFARLIAQVRASLRHAKVELRRRLAVWGIQLKGFEFRGVRRALADGPIAGTRRVTTTAGDHARWPLPFSPAILAGVPNTFRDRASFDDEIRP